MGRTYDGGTRHRAPVRLGSAHDRATLLPFTCPPRNPEAGLRGRLPGHAPRRLGNGSNAVGEPAVFPRIHAQVGCRSADASAGPGAADRCSPGTKEHLRSDRAARRRGADLLSGQTPGLRRGGGCGCCEPDHPGDYRRRTQRSHRDDKRWQCFRETLPSFANSARGASWEPGSWEPSFG